MSARVTSQPSDAKKKPGVPSSRGDVEHFGARRQRNLLRGGAEIVHLFQDVTATVALALFCELFLRGALNGVELHGISKPQMEPDEHRMKSKS
jgi:hypothetical protein